MVKSSTAGIIRILPQLFSVALVIFVSMFTLDVFAEPGWFLALLIHLVPVYFWWQLLLWPGKMKQWEGVWKNLKLNQVYNTLHNVKYMLHCDYYG